MDKPIGGEMTKQNWSDWKRNLIMFSSPILITYLTVISVKMSEPGYVFDWSVFMVTPFIMGMLVKQMIDTLIDFIRKYSSGEPK